MDQIDEYGFTWGPIKVTRVTQVERRRGAGNTRVLQVLTATGVTLNIYVSPTGRSVRVFRGGKELK